MGRSGHLMGLFRSRSEGHQAEHRLLLSRGPGGGASEPGRLAQRICRQRLLRRVWLMRSLGLSEGGVGWQGPGRDAGHPRSLVEGREHSLRRAGPRDAKGLQGPADVHVLTLRQSPGAVPGCAGRWRLPHQAFAEVGEVSLSRTGATGWPGRAHTPELFKGAFLICKQQLYQCLPFEINDKSSSKKTQDGHQDSYS